MAVRRWIASILLLWVLVIGVGLVVAFVLGGTTVTWLVAGATMVVMAWHALRRLEPRPEDKRPEDGWDIAIMGVAIYSGLLLLGFLWTPGVVYIAALAFPIWTRLTSSRPPE